MSLHGDGTAATPKVTEKLYTGVDMSLPSLFFHFFFPHELNNHRARLLHPFSIVVIALGLISFRFLLPALPNFTPVVLGYESNIRPERVVELTNKERAAGGVGELKIDPLLTKAALAKASDMMARDYWAHVAPDGRQPWSFITEMGYQYRFAGENLARDFSTAEDVVAGWMNSSSHRENLLSPKYQDIGIAVVQGNLGGVKTTLVVQFFGTKMSEAAVVEGRLSKFGPRVGAVAGEGGEQISLAELTSRQILLLSPFATTRNITLLFIALLLVVFAVDMIVVRQRNIMRVSSKSLAHFLFFSMILIAVLVAKEGLIK